MKPEVMHIVENFIKEYEALVDKYEMYIIEDRVIYETCRDFECEDHMERVWENSLGMKPALSVKKGD